MKQDRLFENGEVRADFTFNDQVAEVFDDMLSRSIPFYAQVIDNMAALLSRQVKSGSTLYDLGCSTGTALLELARHLPDRQLRFVGLDNAPAMLAKARRKAEMFGKSALVSFREEDITTADLPEAGAILCNYTLQFIRPLTRAAFVRRLFDALPEGGLLLVSEKVISHDPMLNRLFIDLYHQFKLRQGYSELEIAAKREALENVLIPFSIQENRDLLTRAGFRSVETCFQWFNFASFVAIK
ncbi:MAG: carboxy-S-adenosyl-L-methionine synthase CmoA [Desulfobulbus sp.]|nr:MAG: carboxy-S-adenosyl-L-methionine synthase CmoA [Desulfobulbus sp.]